MFKALNIKKREFVKRKHGELFLVSAIQDQILTQASFGRRIPIWSCQRDKVSSWHMDPSSGLNAEAYSFMKIILRIQSSCQYPSVLYLSFLLEVQQLFSLKKIPLAPCLPGERTWHIRKKGTQSWQIKISNHLKCVSFTFSQPNVRQKLQVREVSDFSWQGVAR